MTSPTPENPATAEGYRGGKVIFDGRFVEIAKKGLAAFTSASGSKRIPVKAITAVQIKPAGAMTNGFIQFTIPGGNESRATYGRQTRAAVADENSVIFTKKQQPEFEKMRALIENAMYPEA
ncbi:MAG: DUF4429 domain-containing protein [Pseudonocardia sp.]|uniref:DUF4429 domain-containing protein n=1 Tax=Actinomycetes TaxID=1760 RepID=UPI00086AAE34|nr:MULTISPECIES: DUF4429 domain-containing protein [Actinomycetes]MBN9108547.1 DUF4429 domain-containing protein [Pseudonocardia sp.]ODU27427.1 MAG: hypothetical protein ABS80_03360 [Pseudonocardia sp. SCN 72-51]ODV07811.1 MAG: hypothetical protein ABT15_06960 [Pseudonocardia sp. SCN 73-27]